MGSYYKAHTHKLIDLYRTLAYKSNMETIFMILALLGGGQSDKTLDPVSITFNQVIKGVYNKTRVQEEKKDPHFIDKMRILE